MEQKPGSDVMQELVALRQEVQHLKQVVQALQASGMPSAPVADSSAGGNQITGQVLSMIIKHLSDKALSEEQDGYDDDDYQQPFEVDEDQE